MTEENQNNNMVSFRKFLFFLKNFSVHFVHVQKHQKREKTESVRRALPRLESFVCTVLGNIARKAVWTSLAIGNKSPIVNTVK